MKKMILAAVLAASPFAAFAAPSQGLHYTHRYSGAYIAGGAGMISSSAVISTTLNTGALVIKAGSTSGLSGMLGVGYRFALNQNWLLGAGVGGDISNTELNATVKVATVTASINIKHAHSFYAVGQLGYVYHGNLFSVMAGPTYGKKNITFSFNSKPVNKVSKTGHGWLVGINTEQPLSQHFALVELGTYAFMPETTIDTGNSIIKQIKGKSMKAISAQIALQYTF